MNVEASRRKTKIAFAAVSLILVLAVAGVAMFWYVKSDDAVDQAGPRALIVVGTTGSDRAYTLHTEIESAPNRSARFVFYFSAKNITYSESDAVGLVHATVEFVGFRDQTAITCGADKTPVPEVGAGTLPVGVQTAVRLDADGGTASATNYNGAPGSAQSGHSEPLTYSTFAETLHMLADKDAYYDDRYQDKQLVWAESCELPTSSVWRAPSNLTLDPTSRRTFLAPQVDWTSTGARTDHQEYFEQTIQIRRTSGVQLTESYPPATVDENDWTYDNTVSWNAKLGEADNVGYTDQPVFIFTRRSAADVRAVALMVIGICLGLAASLTLAIASRSADAYWASRDSHNSA